MLFERAMSKILTNVKKVNKHPPPPIEIQRLSPKLSDFHLRGHPEVQESYNVGELSQGES
jgi:hypothetical protein